MTKYTLDNHTLLLADDKRIVHAPLDFWEDWDIYKAYDIIRIVDGKAYLNR